MKPGITEKRENVETIVSSSNVGFKTFFKLSFSSLSSFDFGDMDSRALYILMVL